MAALLPRRTQELKFGINAAFTKFLVYTQKIVELLLKDNLLFENYISTIFKMAALNRRQLLSIILIYMRNRRKTVQLRNKAIANFLFFRI